MRTRTYAAVALAAGACACGTSVSAAEAFNPIKPLCSAAGLVSGLAGKACTVARNGGRLLTAGKQLLTGHVGGAVRSALGQGGGAVASTATTTLALAAIGTWVFGGAKYVLHETSSVLSETTTPQLTSTWFSATYWRVAGIAAVLTLPFLFAAAVQAIIQSDIALLVRAALGYLPLSMFGVIVAAPLTRMLLAAADQMAAIVSSAAGHEGARFLDRASGIAGALTLFGGSPFLAFFIGVLTVAGALALWIELLMREAAVYVVVLMLPLAFASLVWPARRVWAVRAIELLFALIFSKFAIVAVLSLGGAALSASFLNSITGMLAGCVLLGLGAFVPWALLRLLPISEIASSAAGSLRNDGRSAVAGVQRAGAWGFEGHEWAATAARMRQEADEAERADAAAAEGGAAAAAATERERLETLRTPVPSTADGGVGAHPQSAPIASPAMDPTDAGVSARGFEARGAQGAVAERIPGLPAMWQAKNGQWRTLTLGPEDSEVWPPEEAAAGPAAPTESACGEDHDLGPEPQPPEDGHL